MVRALVQVLKILTIVVTAVLIGTGGLAVFDYAVDRTADEEVGYAKRVEITEDDDAGSAARKLKEAGLIKSELLFQGQFRFSGQQLEPGTYTLRKGTTVSGIVDRISGVAPAEEEEEAIPLKVTILEGWRLGQIAEKADEALIAGGFDGTVDAAAAINLGDYDFLQSVPADLPDGVSPLEGYLFPDTYTFMTDDPEGNLRQMLDNFDNRVTPEMRTRAEQMGLTLHQVVTLASIVEREAQLPAERPIIAAVYLNRIEEQIRLQADPTISYVTGKRGAWWEAPTPEQLTGVDSPYNTYNVEGLPPGPIANPSLASIQAVLYPDPVDYIFFVAKGDGTGAHEFATTSEEHNANLCEYGYSLCEE